MTIKFSDISEFSDIKLECPCGKIYWGWKRGSHEFIKEHKIHGIIRLTWVGKYNPGINEDDLISHAQEESND